MITNRLLVKECFGKEADYFLLIQITGRNTSQTLLWEVSGNRFVLRGKSHGRLLTRICFQS